MQWKKEETIRNQDLYFLIDINDWMMHSLSILSNNWKRYVQWKWRELFHYPSINESNDQWKVCKCIKISSFPYCCVFQCMDYIFLDGVERDYKKRFHIDAGKKGIGFIKWDKIYVQRICINYLIQTFIHCDNR